MLFKAAATIKNAKGVKINDSTVVTPDVMAANGVDKQFTVWIDGDHATTVPLGVPEEGTTFLKTLAGSLLTIVVYSLLHH